MSLSLAQTFTVKVPQTNANQAADISGVYLTGVELFIYQRTKDKKLGASVSVYKTKDGKPDLTQPIPYAESFLDANHINKDTYGNANTATYFPFGGLTYLQANEQYALLVDYDGDDPDFFVWTAIAAQNSVDVESKKDLKNLKYDGEFYKSSNEGNSWSLVPDTFLKFQFYRASFNTIGTDPDGYMTFKPKNDDILQVIDTTYASASLKIITGDYVYLCNNTSITSVNVSTRGMVDYYDEAGQILFLSESTGNFNNTNVLYNSSANGILQFHRLKKDQPTNTSLISSNTLVATANLSNFISFNYQYITPKFSMMEPPKTNIQFKFKGTSTNNVSDSYRNVDNEKVKIFNDITRTYASNSDVAFSHPVMRFKANMSTDNKWVTPIIDIDGNAALLEYNIIDSTDFLNYSEFFNNGVGRAKYISKPISIDPNQEAEDLEVYITAHRPPGTDLRVYAKFLNSADPDTLEDKEVTLLYNTSNSFFTDNEETSYAEYRYIVPSNNIVDFTSWTYPISNSTVTVNVSSVSTTILGNNTQFLRLSTDFAVLANNERKRVTSITNNTVMTIDSVFSYTANQIPIYLTYPSTIAYMSNSGLLSQTGTINVSNNSTLVTGTTTNFLNGSLKINDLIKVPLTLSTTDTKRVISIANSTSLNVDTPFSFSNTSTSFSIVTTPGVIYTNTDGSIFTGFSTYQIKVLFYADEPARPPILKDIRAIALQL